MNIFQKLKEWNKKHEEVDIEKKYRNLEIRYYVLVVLNLILCLLIISKS